MRRLPFLCAVALGVVGMPRHVHAQTAPLRVVIECQNTFCDTDYLRTTLSFVTFVRDVSDADVQVLVTEQDNGAGGDTYTLRFIGRGLLAGRTDEVAVPFGPSATDDDERRGLGQALTASLLGYAARAGRLAGLTLTVGVPARASADAAPADERDPWNRWVFTVRGGGMLQGDENYVSRDASLRGAAGRTTGRWKTEISAYGNQSLNRYRLPDSTIDRATQLSSGASLLSAVATGPRTTLGARASVFSSSFSNTDLALRGAVGAEANLYPYAEATARRITARYEVAAQHNDYRDTTLFERTDELLLEHTLDLTAAFQQPWGTLEAGVSGAQFLNHVDQYSLSSLVSMDVRLARGLSVNLGGIVNLTRNQRAIRRGKASDADVFTRRRALASGYDFLMGGGLRYTFGSKLSGAVNPRYQTGYNLSIYY